ncbi:MAG: prephenate dehydratase, partial [Deltaproteobacteria bacterium]|nr:prephenate dehydratase [Deltaproteobacteria bacterium]
MNSTPEHSRSETSLDDIRQRIDRVDEALLALLDERAGLSRQVGAIKSDSRETVFKPFREKEVMGRLLACHRTHLPDDHLRHIYREILSSSRRLQRAQKVVYLGPEGTFSYFAGLEYLGHSQDFEPQRDLEEVFRAVSRGDAELGVIPLENSLQGSVGQSLDLFLRFDVFIQAEIYCRISHCLMSPETDLASVKVVHSHPQALAQCSAWLRNTLPQASLVPAESTAAAARLAGQIPGSAAIGHRRLAEMSGLNVLASQIEDLHDNWTRFLVIGSVPPREGNRDKTSLVFTLPDTPGSLVAVLQLLAGEGINLKKLESRPLRSEKWKYVFFMDVECDLGRNSYTDLLKRLAA